MAGPRARRVGRKDVAQAAIERDAPGRGIEVFCTSSVGGLGFDVVCYHKSYDLWLPFELKSDNAISKQSKSKRLRESQVRARARAPIPVASSIAEIEAVFDVARSVLLIDAG